MAEPTDSPESNNDSDVASSTEDNLKRTLVKRIAITGLLVVSLLGGLTVFDAMYVPQIPVPKKEATATTVAAEEPEATEEVVSDVVTEAPVVSDESAASVQQIVDGKEIVPLPTPPERTSAPAGTLPPMTQDKPLTPPARVKQAVIQPPVQPPSPEVTLHRPSTLSTPSKPLTHAAESYRQFVVQVGTFNNVTNATELFEKLKAAGIPARIEARVQVGPFATRQAAELAREKLRSLGMDAGFLATANK
ncbi:MAG: SPOR domain-containing protein [Rhodocyclaceae bacterium]|nr:SPOR domain-containing protein [Rhodocyclaceae bacterium]